MRVPLADSTLAPIAAGLDETYRLPLADGADAYRLAAARAHGDLEVVLTVSEP